MVDVMKAIDIVRARLSSQLLGKSQAKSCAEVVSTLGALQAQDDASVLWSIGVRLPGATLAQVEHAIAQGSVVRSWLLRGTLHVAAAQDIRFILALVAPRLLQLREARRTALALDARNLLRCEKAITRALAGGKRVTREQAGELFRAVGVEPEGQRAYHVLSHLALQRVICFGPNQGNQHTFVLLDEWVPAQPELSEEEACARLASCYFRGRAPASVADFGWWSGLTAARVKLGMANCERAPDPTPVSGTSAQLLPGFDEYLLGYKDRSAQLPAQYADKVVPGSNGIFLPTLLVNGQVVGTWKRIVGKTKVRIVLAPFAPLPARSQSALASAAKQYGKFLGLTVELG